jgi:hypothetical protein
MTQHHIQIRADEMDIKHPTVKASTDSPRRAIEITRALQTAGLYVHVRVKGVIWSHWHRMDDLSNSEILRAIIAARS